MASGLSAKNLWSDHDENYATHLHKGPLSQSALAVSAHVGGG